MSKLQPLENTVVCSIAGCGQKHYGRGWCRKHFYRWYRYGSTDIVKPHHKTHGKSYTSEYRSWEHMKSRCNNPNAARYNIYGGRGISVCDRWMNSFENFLCDMGAKPGAEYSIDRIDSDGNYEPNNCRWANIQQQSANRRPRGKTCRFRGVSKNKRNTWTTNVCVKGKTLWIGDYQSVTDAAIAYNVAAQIFHGPYAYRNRI